MAIGELQFEGRASLGPGERATATIVFLPWAPLLPLLQPGFEWRLQEGRRVVGRTQLVEVLPTREVLQGVVVTSFSVML